MSITSGSLAAKDIRFKLQSLLQLNGRAAVSLTGQVSWVNRFITMTAGSREQEPDGYHDIYFPSVGTTIAKTDGASVTVAAPITGQNGASGGIPLLPWETLWYRVETGSSFSSSAANFRIAQHTANGNQTNPESLLGVSGGAADEWVRIVSRDGSDMFVWGTGDATRLGFQFGQGMDIQAVVDYRQQLGLHMEGIGYAFRPWNLTNSVVSFGFSSLLRMISGAANSDYQRINGYTDVPVPAVGTVIYGISGAPNKVWRVTIANDAMYRFGHDSLFIPAATPVVDLDEYNTLWFAPDQATSSVTGTWYYTRYDLAHTVPSHWILIAQRRDQSQNVFLWNGESIKRGEALSRGTHDQVLHRSRGELTSSGLFECRFTQPGFFSGTAANGLGEDSNTVGALVHWAVNTMMWGMDGGTQGGGAPFMWIDIPSSGYAIPVLDAAGTRTRVVQNIGGRLFVPLAGWETLIYIPPQASQSSAASINAGWFVIKYGDGRFIPAHAITVASYAAPSQLNGSGAAKTRVKMGDGTYISPGVAFATTPALGDHATGTTLDWRPAVVAGQTPPAATAALPAVTGVTNNNFAYRYVQNQHDARGRVELTGSVNAAAAIPDGTHIAFLPGVQALSAESLWIGLSVRHGNNTAVPASAVVTLTNTAVGGQFGTRVTLYGYSAANSSVQNGGPYGVGGIIAFAGLSFAHA
jgi:hypothetical protein